ncbi:TPA: hypothetical protein NQF56_002397 [Klebsiella variicola]|nr:hypothetical protein [Klebsiella variicola]
MLHDMTCYFDKFTHNLPMFAFISSLITFSLGLYVGHKTAVWRDRRKEFNEVAEPLLAYFEQVRWESGNKLNYSNALMPIESIGKVSRRLSKKKSIELEQIIQKLIAYRNSGHFQYANEINKECIKGCRILRLR